VEVGHDRRRERGSDLAPALRGIPAEQVDTPRITVAGRGEVKATAKLLMLALVTLEPDSSYWMASES
jgi:hypothetical protein